MAQRRRYAGVAGIGNDGTGEVQGVSVTGKGHFDNVRVVQILPGADGAGDGGHGEGFVRDQGFRQPVNQGRVNERFVPLNIDDMGGGRERTYRFRQAVTAAGMVRRGHDGPGSKGYGGVKNALVVRGDGDGVQAGTAADAFPYVLDKRFSCNGMKGLARKSGGTPA